MINDVKYKTKYKELKGKIAEIEEDNTKLQLRVLKSKKNIQRLRVERAILYDRLQSSAQPTNPFALHAHPHLSSLPSTSLLSTSSSHPIVPPSILHPAPYPLANPDGPELYLQELDARKLAAIKAGDEFGTRPELGISGEREDRIKREVSPVGNGHQGEGAMTGEGMLVDQSS
ncbi:hypothetical protein RQP46_007409 [Phenoliferia psychrophenolica]